MMQLNNKQNTKQKQKSKNQKQTNSSAPCGGSGTSFNPYGGMPPTLNQSLTFDYKSIFLTNIETHTGEVNCYPSTPSATTLAAICPFGRFIEAHAQSTLTQGPQTREPQTRDTKPGTPNQGPQTRDSKPGTPTQGPQTRDP